MASDGALEAIVGRLKVMIADILGDVDADEIPEDLPLFDAEYGVDGLALDSLDSLKLAVALAQEYHLDPDVEVDYTEVRTVREIAEYVQGLVGGLEVRNEQ